MREMFIIAVDMQETEHNLVCADLSIPPLVLQKWPPEVPDTVSSW